MMAQQRILRFSALLLLVLPLLLSLVTTFISAAIDDEIAESELDSSSSSSSSSSHKCIHDDEEHQSLTERHLRETDGLDLLPSQRAASSLSTVPQKLRIKVSAKDLFDPGKYCVREGQVVPSYRSKPTTVRCDKRDILTPERRKALGKALSHAVAILKDSLLLERPLASSNLIVPKTACSGLDYTIPESHTTTGVPDADFVIYVSASSVESSRAGSSSIAAAWASRCVRNSDGRPIVGRATFIPRFLAKFGKSKVATAEIIARTVHEMLHALGFSGGQFEYKKAFKKLVTSTSLPDRGISVVYFAGEKAKAAAQKHFGCSSALGIELEGAGGSGSAGSHIDMRVLPDDVMAASSGGGNLIRVLSPITLAVMEDLDVGYKAAPVAPTQTPTFGYQAGCDFLTKKCNVNGGKFGTPASAAAVPYFCFEKSDPVDECSYDYSFAGPCGIRSYPTDIPSPFRYFPADPKKGGSQFADYCPFANSFSNRLCTVERRNSKNEQLMGFEFGASSRCFAARGVLRQGLTGSSLGGTRCLVSRCDKATGKVQFQINGSAWISCPGDGATVSLPAGWQGTVTCPNAKSFCRFYDLVPLLGIGNASGFASPVFDTSGSEFDGSGVNTAVVVVLVVVAIVLFSFCVFIAWREYQKPTDGGENSDAVEGAPGPRPQLNNQSFEMQQARSDAAVAAAAIQAGVVPSQQQQQQQPQYQPDPLFAPTGTVVSAAAPRQQPYVVTAMDTFE